MPTDSAAVGRTRTVAVEWTGVGDVPLRFVNQIAAQLGTPAGPDAVPDSVILLFGLADQPLLIGEPEDVQRQADAIRSIEVRTQARLVMSRERAAELRLALDRLIAAYDGQAKT